jgi:glycosyltransferase involved in cell wall biosynthesis
MVPRAQGERITPKGFVHTTIVTSNDKKETMSTHNHQRVAWANGSTPTDRVARPFKSFDINDAERTSNHSSAHRGTRKLRIAQISNLFEPITDSSTNGLAQIVYILSQELVDLGHDVTLYARFGSSTNARLVPLSDLTNASDTILGKVLPVAAAFADWRNFDIIHDHTRFYSTLFAHFVPISVVSTVHHPIQYDELHWQHPAEDYATFFRSTWNGLVKHVNTVCVSRFQRAGFSGKAEVIYNGIPLKMWSRPSFGSGRYLAFLGAINETKGTHEAIMAALLAGERIIIAGTTDENDEYFQRRIKPFVDGRRVKYIGSVNFEQKQRFLAEAKAVLMPIQWDDPLPTVALESLASGTPVIAWNRSSLGEIVEDGKSGFLVSSVEEMAARVKDLWRLDRKACRSRAELLFDSRVMAERYVSLYRTLLGSPSDRRPRAALQSARNDASC